MKSRLLFYCLILFNKTFSQESSAFIVKPYLQVGSTPSIHSIQILWVTDVQDHIWNVETKSKNDQKWRRADPPQIMNLNQMNIKPRKLYIATIINLEENQKFDYRIISDDREVLRSTGQSIKSPNQSYRFTVIGDLGAGTHEQKTTAQQLKQANPDLVVIPGDIVYDRGLLSEYDTRFFNVYNAKKEDTGGIDLMGHIPFVPSTGNHDSETRNLDTFPDALSYYTLWSLPLNGPRMTEGSAAVPKLIANETNRKAFIDAAGGRYPVMTNYSMDYGNAHFTFLDSNPYVDWTDKELQSWLATDLQKSISATWHFVVFHHPGFNSSREHYEQQHMRLLSPVFEKYQVDVVFTGHVHNYQRTYPLTFAPDHMGALLLGGRNLNIPRGRIVNGLWHLDKKFDGKKNTTPKGVIYLISGAGGKELYNPEQTNDPDTWQKFTCNYSALEHSISIIDIDGNHFTCRQLSDAGKELDKFEIRK